MKDDLFADLIASVREGGDILRRLDETVDRINANAAPADAWRLDPLLTAYAASAGPAPTTDPAWELGARLRLALGDPFWWALRLQGLRVADDGEVATVSAYGATWVISWQPQLRCWRVNVRLQDGPPPGQVSLTEATLPGWLQGSLNAQRARAAPDAGA